MMDGSNPVVAERPQVTHAPPVMVAPPAPRPPRRKRAVIAAAALAVLGAAGFYGYGWWTDGRFLISTDDAYIQSDMVAVSARVAGQVGEVLVGDNEQVRKGQVLLRLDDRDLQAALAGDRADVASAQADINALAAQLQAQTATIAAADADVASADAAVVFARAEAARYSDLQRTGSGSLQRSQQADSDIRSREAAALRARAMADGARRQVAVLQAQLGRSQAALLRARATASQAELNLSYGTVTAPIDGVVGDRSVRAGQYVQPGTRMLDVVPMGQGLYVTANFKETQLNRMAAGEAVRIDIDMLGGNPLRGVVDSLAPGSGSTFALLPPENATGNFTKIVQRVPVRVRLLPDDRLAFLRPGLSVTASVDMRTAPQAQPNTRP